jgi:hypothetical protein
MMILRAAISYLIDPSQFGMWLLWTSAVFGGFGAAVSWLSRIS